MGAVTEVIDTGTDIVGGAVNAISDAGSAVDDFVNQEIPGGWATVGLAAGAATGLIPTPSVESSTGGLLGGGGAEGALTGYEGLGSGLGGGDLYQTLGTGAGAGLADCLLFNFYLTKQTVVRA